MRTLEKMFKKNRLRLAVLMAAVGLVSSLHAAGLENGPGNGPGKETKDSLKSEVKVPLKSALVKLNTKAGVKKEVSAHHYVARNGKVYDDLIWFPATGTDAGCPLSQFNLNAGTRSANPPSGCGQETTLCCSISYALEDCEETSPGVWRVKDGHQGNDVERVYLNEQ